MTTGGPDQPAGGYEYPPIGGPDAPVDYPTGEALPPPYPLPPASYPPPPPGYPPASGYPPGPGYYPAYDPYRPLKPPGTNGKAVASMVCSLVGLTCCGVTAIIGVILGVIAMRETRASGQDGHAFALAGTIIGGLAIAGWSVYILLYAALLASGWQWI
jgi:hypothetical protein